MINSRIRAVKSKAFTIITFSATTLSIALLFSLLIYIGWKGLSVMSLDFLFTRSMNFGAEGGIFYQIFGSLLMLGGAMILSFPIAFGAALFLSEYVRSRSLKKFILTLIYGLNGVPSIVYGLFGLIIFVHLMSMGISWLTGSFILAIIMLPTILIVSYQTMQRIPRSYIESSKSLGLNRWQVIRTIIIPQSFSGAITGLLLASARAIGETAPIMFTATAFMGILIPHSFFDPVSTLPTHILALAQQATNPAALARAWGASFVLISLVFFLSLLAYLIRSQFLYPKHK